jgi:hypothetical protein
MAQGRSTKVISMIKWVRTSRLSIKKYLSFSLLLQQPEESTLLRHFRAAEAARPSAERWRVLEWPDKVRAALGR